MRGITYSLITYSTIPFQMTPNSKWYHSYNKCRLKYQTIRLHISFNMGKIPRTLLAFILKLFSIAFCMLPAVLNHATFLFSPRLQLPFTTLLGFNILIFLLVTFPYLDSVVYFLSSVGLSQCRPSFHVLSSLHNQKSQT